MQIHIAAGANVHIHGLPPSEIQGQLIQLPAHVCNCAGRAAADNYQDTPALGELWPGQGGYYVGILPALGDRPAQHLIASAQEAEGLSVILRAERPRLVDLDRLAANA